MTKSPPPIDAAVARSALKIVQDSAQRGTTLYRYSQASPFFFLWALVWFLGFGLSDVFPGRVGTVWLCADLLGVVGSVVLAQRTLTHKGTDHTMVWRLGGMAAALGVLVFCTLLIFEVRSGRQVASFFGLLVACVYTLVGCWSGLRWLLAGVLMWALTLSGYFLLPAYFNVWMGCVGGGTLALTGLWMRRV